MKAVVTFQFHPVAIVFLHFHAVNHMRTLKIRMKCAHFVTFPNSSCLMFVSCLDATFSLISVPLALPGVDCLQRKLGIGDAPGDKLLL